MKLGLSALDSLHAKLEALGEEGPLPEALPPVARRTLDPLERAMILHAKRKNPQLPDADLARAFGVAPETVKALVKKYAHLPPIRELLRGIAPEAVRDMSRASRVAAERGDLGPAERILIHAGEVEPISERSERGYGPRIVVGILPGMPQPTLPAPKASRLSRRRPSKAPQRRQEPARYVQPPLRMPSKGL